MDFLIRDMKKADWPRVKEIYEQALEEGKATFQVRSPSYKEWDNSHLKEGRVVIVVEDRVVGWCAVSPTSSRAAYNGVVEDSIYMDKQVRENGLATKLLEHLCHVCEEKGYWCIYAAVFANNEASIRLHKRCGFREIGYRERIAKDRFGIWQNTILLEKRV